MNRRLSALALLLSSCCGACFGQEAAVPLAETSLIDHETSVVDLKLNHALAPYIEDHTVAGLVAVVASRDNVLAQTTMGMANVERQAPMQTDSICWIASMSKPVTGVCIMMLVDEGKIALNDDIANYLPEMKQLKLADGSPAKITIQQLMTHTSGMSEVPAPHTYTDPTLAEVASRYARGGMDFVPGAKWQYSQTSINTAGRIIEVVSGMTLDQFIQQRICEPLGMVDTTFYLSDDQAKRQATPYETTTSGDLIERPIWLLAGKPATFRGHYPAANGGLFSTAADYTKFCQMLLNDGTLNGKQLLSKEAVQTLRTIQTGNFEVGFTPGNGWGIGVCVVKEPQGVTASLSPGSYGHGGAYGTQAWIDPVKNRIYVLMVQRSNFPNSDASELRQTLMETGSKL